MRERRETVHKAFKEIDRVLKETAFRGYCNKEMRKHQTEDARDVLTEYVSSQAHAYINMIESPRFNKCPVLHELYEPPKKRKRLSKRAYTTLYFVAVVTLVPAVTVFIDWLFRNFIR